ncbi:hypothetical protein HB13667_16085 [Pseudomonas putida]|jgi:hypothetical protein|uniref:Uncharacterized protein n=2 Tax=Pseudomonas TaxID=286 RepID=A0A0P7DB27_PSEPU|nr:MULTISPECIES: hypothetical protein [Pseudomonas]GJB85012.1 hypothetical protein KAM380_094770 [Aeromonas caviae]KPM62931.1 hypothetical protein HB13667_16085 [Pseudomonas putida]MBO2925412.1 hypothetical protein [Pseudomonas asiatica]MCO7537764.1 hypothetical protein [Pseudomonas asiatica]MCO7551584.1 hypothetical protein [Pseudomonas asiatica]
MNKPIEIATLNAGPLAFTADPKVSGAQLLDFVHTVDQQIESVTKGLVEQLKKEKINARVAQQGRDYLIIQEGVNPASLSQHDSVETDPAPQPSRIRIYVRSSDAPPTINAMRLFFRDWRAVAGLIAVGGAWQLGQWLMQVRRQDQ